MRVSHSVSHHHAHKIWTGRFPHFWRLNNSSTNESCGGAGRLCSQSEPCSGELTDAGEVNDK
jgi:hypothetical protein